MADQEGIAPVKLHPVAEMGHIRELPTARVLYSGNERGALVPQDQEEFALEEHQVAVLDVATVGPAMTMRGLGEGRPPGVEGMEEKSYFPALFRDRGEHSGLRLNHQTAVRISGQCERTIRASSSFSNSAGLQ